MKFYRSSLSCLILLLSKLSGSISSNAHENEDSNQVRTLQSITGNEDTDDYRYIIKFKTQNRFLSAHRTLKKDSRTIKSLPEDKVVVMTITSIEDLEYWQDRDDVEYVEKDTRIYPLAESTPWGIDAVKAMSVSDNTISNQRVCIIDSGYDINHPDLPSGNNVSGTSLINGESWIEDGSGHGTHVAGTIAAIGGNNQGVVGVNRNGQINLHIVKIFSNSGAFSYTSDLIEAAEACASAGSTVINMSLGGKWWSVAESNAFDRIAESGILLVAAAGNDGDTSKLYPASYSSVISVGAIDSNKNRASFSNYNDEVDIVAPGNGVRSTTPGGYYSTYDGTSMASPHVAGVAALVWSNFPNKSNEEIRQVLESSAEDLGVSGRDNQFGHGLVRADRAYSLLNVMNPPTGDPICVDKAGWYDSDGVTYNCEWYTQGDNCQKFGHLFPNFGQTANQACCACNSQNNGGCTDDPLGWNDSDGPIFNCEWYSQADNCATYGGFYGVQGRTANQACCACGGGKR